jgi:hypothetical protein
MGEQTTYDAIPEEVRRLLADYQAECVVKRAGPLSLIEVSAMESGCALLDAPRPLRVAALNTVLARTREVGLFPVMRGNDKGAIVPVAPASVCGFVPLLCALLDEPLFNELDETLPLLRAVEDTGAVHWARYGNYVWDAGSLLDAAVFQLLQFVSDHEGGFPEFLALLERLLPTYLMRPDESPTSKRLRVQAEIALGLRPEEPPLVKAKPWGVEALTDLAQMPPPERKGWKALLRFVGATCLESPSKARLERLRAHHQAVGSEAFERYAVRWFGLVAAVTGPLIDRNSSALRGLVWCTGAVSDSPQVAAALADLAAAGYRKLPRAAARSIVLGDACVGALGRMPAMAGVASLARLRATVRHPAALAAIERTFADAARRTGISPDELEEVALPTFGLDAGGRLSLPIGGYAAENAVDGGRLAGWRWRKPDGREQKSVPAVVKQKHADAWQEAKSAAEVLEQALSGQRARLERLLLQSREWSVSIWRDCYQNHPLVLGLARRLIWRFECPDGIVWLGLPLSGGLVDEYGTDVAGRLSDDVRVRLWHPLDSDPATVLRWRSLLEERRIQQPFKQAHREVYLLTDAERATRVYSNRFAAHLLRLYQFHALCGQRGWSSQTPRYGSGSANASRVLPQAGLIADFRAEPLWDGRMSDTGVPDLTTTDQVRFRRHDTDAPLPLSDLPPLVFSEVMRDVDLFVGVASLGNDPNWADGGPQGRFRNYWQDYSFGDLTESAKTRADVLSRLLPRLKIADRCRLDGRFLIVRGDLRTYKIHLGSGNILMEPNDQYLCIVAKSGVDEGAGGLFLPFEGDLTLSVIVSKAFLLAADTRITDPTITRQIGVH